MSPEYRFRKMVMAVVLVLGFCAFAGAQEMRTVKNGPDWIEGSVYATTSYSGVDMSRMTSKGQAIQEALTQAYDLACVQLSKEINGLSINTTRLYERSATQDNILKTQTEGLVKNARIYSQKVEWVVFKGEQQPLAEVTVVIPMAGKKGLAAIAADWEKRTNEQRPRPQRYNPDIDESGTPPIAYDGLIIDATGTSLEPVLNPKILTANGAQELYGVGTAVFEEISEKRLVGYASSVEAARKNSRVSPNALVIRAIKSHGTRNGDAVVSRDDAKQILVADVDSNFLSECNVIFVVD